VSFSPKKGRSKGGVKMYVQESRVWVEILSFPVYRSPTTSTKYSLLPICFLDPGHFLLLLLLVRSVRREEASEQRLDFSYVVVNAESYQTLLTHHSQISFPFHIPDRTSKFLRNLIKLHQFLAERMML